MKLEVVYCQCTQQLKVCLASCFSTLFSVFYSPVINASSFSHTGSLVARKQLEEVGVTFTNTISVYRLELGL